MSGTNHVPDKPNDPIALSIVSESRLLREGLIPLIRPYLNVRLIGSYTSTTDCASLAPSTSDQIILIDGSIGQEVAVRWTRWWRRQGSQVIILELDDARDVILNCIEAGAIGYTLKEAPPAEVAQAIQRAHRGEAVCSPTITAYIFARLVALQSPEQRLQPVAVPLTPRELEVLHCIARGMSNKEIAAALVIEIYTVKHHVHRILEKLQMRHRRDAAQFAKQQGWLQI